MKVSKILTLNSVELNQVMLDFASLINEIESSIKSDEVCVPADLLNFIGPIKCKSTVVSSFSTYEILKRIEDSTFVKVED